MTVGRLPSTDTVTLLQYLTALRPRADQKRRKLRKSQRSTELSVSSPVLSAEEFTGRRRVVRSGECTSRVGEVSMRRYVGVTDVCV